MENPASLLRRLNPCCARAMEGAASLCHTRAHAEILPEHWLLKLLEQGEGDLTVLARRYEWDMDALWQDLLSWLDKQPRSVRHRPQLSDHILRLMQEAWLIASLSGETQIRSVHLLMALVEKPNLIQCDGLWPLLTLGQRQLERLRSLLDAQSDERPPAQQEAALAGHHLMKSVRWDTLTELPPLDATGRTRLLPPKPESKAHLKRLYLQKSWSELLEHTDTLLAQGVNHLWLDVQWYAWQALLKLDADSVRADILCRDMKGLLARLPGLETLAFNDGTPFADEVTLNWLNERVLDEMAGWQDEPVMAATSADEVLSLEPEVLTRADDEGIESALNWLQAQPGYTTSRNRWLMRLLMARVSEQYGKNEMALHLLAELDSRAREITLEQWKPELIFEVKARRLRLLRGKAGRSEAEKNRLLPEMESLLAGLIALDPARAAVLCA